MASLALFSAGTISIALAHVWLPNAMEAFYSKMIGSFVSLGALLCVSIIAGGLILLAPRHRGAAPAAAVVLALVLQVATFASPPFSEIYGGSRNAIQWPTYLIGQALPISRNSICAPASVFLFGPRTISMLLGTPPLPRVVACKTRGSVTGCPYSAIPNSKNYPTSASAKS